MPEGNRRSRALSGLALQEENNAPMMAIFGGVFALMLVVLVVVNIYSSAALRERLERGDEQGMHRIERTDGGAGYVVLTFPETLRITETNTSVPLGSICRSGSAFVDYAREIYDGRAGSDDRVNQIVFFVLEGSVSTLAEARNCMLRMWPGRLILISWVMVDNEFLKSVALNDIPEYIRGYVESTAPGSLP